MEAEILSLLREGLVVAARMAAPLLLAALVTGLAIGLFQALTSIQEMTLTFVPKIAVILFVFLITASSTVAILVGFFDNAVIGELLR